MKPLDRVRRTIQAEITVRQIIKELLVGVEDGIENKIIMEMVPQYSIENINNISSNLLSCLESRHERLDKDINSPIQEPKPINFDKRMQRTCQWTFPNRITNIGSFHDSNKSTIWKTRLNGEDWTKNSTFKQLEGIKQESMSSSLQLNFESINPPSQMQNSLRRIKQQEQRRKQKNDSRQETDHVSKSVPTSRQIGALLQLKKDFTYDYNGGVIPINRLDKTFQSKIDVSYDFSDKTKEKIASNLARQSKLKSRLKKPELKLEQSPTCFFDNKSAFYKNFDFQKRYIDSRQKQIPDKVYNGQLPNYMRILTQEGGIKKRYARYNDKGQINNNSSLLKQRLRQNSYQSEAKFRVSTKQNQRPTLTKLTFTNSSQISSSASEAAMRLPRTDRIRIFNQKIRQKIIEPQFRSQTESDLSQMVNISNSYLIELGAKKSKNKRLPGIDLQIRN